MIKNINSICIGAALFTGGYTPISWLVRTWDNFVFSHVAMYIGNGQLVEADIGGVQINPISKYIDSCIYYGEVVTPRLSNTQLALSVAEAVAQVNDQYDYSLLLGNALMRLLRRGRSALGLYDWRNAWLCSELLAHSYAHNGLSLGTMKPYQVRPKNLYQILKEK